MMDNFQREEPQSSAFFTQQSSELREMIEKTEFCYNAVEKGRSNSNRVGFSTSQPVARLARIDSSKMGDISKKSDLNTRGESLDVKKMKSIECKIRELGNAGKLMQCRRLWESIQEMELSDQAYGCMLDSLVKNGALDEAVNLFFDLKSHDVTRPNAVMYSTIIKGFAQTKQLEKALHVYEEMRKDGVAMNTVTFNCLIDVCARLGAMTQAAQFLADMIEQKLDPDLITFSTIIKGYCVHGDLRKALMLFETMRSQGIEADGVLYNSLLDGCVKTGKTELCEELWIEMQHLNIMPSNFTITVLIKLYGRLGDLRKAFGVVRDLPLRYNFTINVHVYTCLMSACISNHQYYLALSVFKNMISSGIQPDKKTYETALNGCLRGGLITDAVRVVLAAWDHPLAFQCFPGKQPSERTVPLSLSSYRALLQQISSSPDVLQVLRLPFLQGLRELAIPYPLSLEPSPLNRLANTAEPVRSISADLETNCSELYNPILVNGKRIVHSTPLSGAKTPSRSLTPHAISNEDSQKIVHHLEEIAAQRCDPVLSFSQLLNYTPSTPMVDSTGAFLDSTCTHNLKAAERGSHGASIMCSPSFTRNTIDSANEHHSKSGRPMNFIASAYHISPGETPFGRDSIKDLAVMAGNASAEKNQMSREGKELHTETETGRSSDNVNKERSMLQHKLRLSIASRCMTVEKARY